MIHRIGLSVVQPVSGNALFINQPNWVQLCQTELNFAVGQHQEKSLDKSNQTLSFNISLWVLYLFIFSNSSEIQH